MADLFTFPNMTGGIDQGLVDISAEVVVYPILFLVSIFFFIVLGGSSLQAKRSGYVDFPIWVVIGLLTTDFAALLMSLTLGIISPVVLSVSVTLTLFAGVWFFLSRGRYEN